VSFFPDPKKERKERKKEKKESFNPGPGAVTGEEYR